MIQQILQRLFSREQPESPQQPEVKLRTLLLRTDAEYESLFFQLLAGVNDESWTHGRVRGFLDGNNIADADLAAWLRGFSEKLLAADEDNHQLGMRMLRLSKVGCGRLEDVSCGVLGEVAGEISRKLLRRGGEEEVGGENGKQKREEGNISEVDKLTVLKQNDNSTQQHSPNLGFENEQQQIFPINESSVVIPSIELKPDYYQAWYNRGDVLGELGRLEEAIASYDKAIEFKPDYYQAWYNRGYALGELGRLEEAIASYDKAIEFKPDYYQAWYNRGVALYQLGRLEEAITSYDKAIEFKPDYYQAWGNRGSALAELGRLEEAIASYDKAIEIKPDYYQAWVNRGNALDDLGRLEEGMASNDKAIEIKPDGYEAWNNRGNALYQLGRLEEGMASYDKAIEFKPDYYDAWLNRGCALANLGRLEEGMASNDKAIEIKPDDYNAWINRGSLLRELGRLEEAIASYDKAIEIKPDYYNTWYNRGIALTDLGRLEEAIASNDKAIEIKPDGYEAWENRGIAAGKSISLNQLFASSSPITIQNPALNQCGYEGELTSYQEGLKYCQQNTHPEGWGMLHQAIGNAHYFQGKGERNYREYWLQAKAEYHQALVTLTPEAFPELHLELLRDLIRVLFGLKKDDEAKQWRRQALEVFAQLVNSPNKSSWQKRQLAAKFYGFSQMRVDKLIEDGDFITALEAAERDKNFHLTWILDKQKEHILSPSYSEIQELVNPDNAPNTAIIYWHFSPHFLTTFIIQPGVDKPIVIPTQTTDKLVVCPISFDEFPALVKKPQRAQRTQRKRIQRIDSSLNQAYTTPHNYCGQTLETWIKNWDEQYDDSRKDTKEKISNSAWRDNLPQLLTQLGEILNIPHIIESIENSNVRIQNLILIPHRDLHRFPLHALFPDNFTINYLPSAEIGLTLNSQPQNSQQDIINSPNLLIVEYSGEGRKDEGLQMLTYAEIESEIIERIFENTNSKYISDGKANKNRVTQALAAGYNIFHFSGHGSYDNKHPQNSALYLNYDSTNLETNPDLTLPEIRNLDLSGYQLVSLSSCETAITGSETIEKEYVGLASAFLYQGVSHVVSTLWTVNEISTGLLMIYFYRQIRKGKTPNIALSTAIKWLRNLTYKKLNKLSQITFNQLREEDSSLPVSQTEIQSLENKKGKLFDHPYYWAGFTITGV